VGQKNNATIDYQLVALIRSDPDVIDNISRNSLIANNLYLLFYIDVP
jgi:hypothetical protein